MCHRASAESDSILNLFGDWCDVFYTIDELKATHVKTGHQSIRNSVRYLKLGNPGVEVTEEDVNKLKQILSQCLVCERFGRSPRRMRTAAPYELVFNRAVVVDIVHLVGRKSTTSFVCCGTKIMVTKAIESANSSTLFSVFMQEWVLRFPGPPTFLIVDEQRSFVSDEFISNCEKIGVQVISKGTEHHWAWGIGERLNDTLRKCFEKAFIADETKSWPFEDLLALCTHYVNGACYGTSINPYLLVYGQMTRPLSNHTPDFEVLENGERLAVLNVARNEAERVRFRNSYLESRRRSMPTSCDDLKAGDLCYVWRESSPYKLRTKGKGFMGPFIFLYRSGTSAAVAIRGRVHNFAATHIKPAPASEQVKAGMGLEAVQEAGELLATKPPPPMRLDPSMKQVEPVFDESLDRSQLNPEIAENPDWRIYSEDEDAVNTAFSQTMALYEDIDDPDLRTFYVRGDSICEKEKLPVGSPQSDISQYCTPENTGISNTEGYRFRFCDLSLEYQKKVSEMLTDLVDDPELEESVYITEIIVPGHKRYDKEKVEEAIRTEIQGQIDQKAIEFVLANSIPEDANVIGTRIILAIKQFGTESELWKARMVMQGNLDREKNNIVSDSGGLSSLSVRLVVIMSLAYGWNIWTRDVKQAYLQGGKLSRDLYARLPKELRSKLRGYVLKILAPIYGVKEAGCYFTTKYINMHIKDLRMISTILDKFLLYRLKEIALIENGTRDQKAGQTYPDSPDGCCALQVDDGLFTGTDEFRQDEREMHKQLKMGSGMDLEKDGKLEFSGVTFVKEGADIIAHQRNYVEAKIEKVRPEKGVMMERTTAKQIAGTLAWIATQTAPQISIEVSKLNQMITFDDSSSKFANTAITKAIKKGKLGMRFKKLDLDSMYVAGYADASLGSNPDLSSQIGGFVCVRDKYGVCCPAAWFCRKGQRKAGSALASEVIGFVTLFDYAFMVRHTLSKMTNRKVPLYLFTDSYSMFSTITKSSSVREKRLLLDLAIIREAYSDKAVDNIGFVRTKFNIADCLTKIMTTEQMDEAFTSGFLSHEVAEYIIADENLPISDTPTGSKEVDLSVFLSSY